jgi:hypothetical protein
MKFRDRGRFLFHKSPAGGYYGCFPEDSLPALVIARPVIISTIFKRKSDAMRKARIAGNCADNFDKLFYPFRL